MFLINVVEILKAHFTLNFPPKIVLLYEITWKHVVQPDRQTVDDNIIRRLRFTCWISLEPPGTHSEYVAILDFRRKQWLRGSTSVLRFVPKLPAFCLLPFLRVK